MLDNPAWFALTGPDSRLAIRTGDAVKVRPDVGVFAAVPDNATDADWAALALNVGAGVTVGLPGRSIPNGWRGQTIECDQMVDEAVDEQALTALVNGSGVEVTPLGDADVPEMLGLTERTRPGPFEERTIEFGGYVGVRIDGVLAAMAGERLHLPGWTEVSAVCTDPAFRGRGLARVLVAAVTLAVGDRGDHAFLHVAVGNPAKRVYEALGFRDRVRYPISVATPPA